MENEMPNFDENREAEVRVRIPANFDDLLPIAPPRLHLFRFTSMLKFHWCPKAILYSQPSFKSQNAAIKAVKSTEKHKNVTK